MAAAESTSGGVKKKSWAKRIAIGVSVGAVVLLAGGYLLVPVIASSKAPGMIEEAAGKAINGSVKVGSVSVGWAGPVTVNGLELRDPEGKLVGTFNVQSSLGIWKVLGGLRDLGTTKVSGRIDVVRTTDASGKSTTNLERAIAGKTGTRTTGTGKSGPTNVPAMSGRLDVTGIDATFEERDSAGAVVGRAAMKGLKGGGAFSTEGAGSADVKLDAGFGEKLEGPSTGSLALKAAVASFVQSGTLALEKASIDATVETKGAPINLFDALTNQGGTLSGALGPTADATVVAKGTLAAMNADIVLNAPNAAADLGVKTESAPGGASRLHATRKGSLNLKSLAFVSKMPAVAEGLKNAGVTVTGWPGVSVTVNSLDVPAGGEGGWAGAKVEVAAVTTGDVTGTIARPGVDGKPGAAEALVVKPLTITVAAPDLAKGAQINGSTSATIGGRSAGAFDLAMQVSDLVGTDGKLAATSGGIPGRIAGKVEAKGVATGLLAPFAAGAGVPLDLAADVGPTLDLTVNASTSGAPTSPSSPPPTDISINLKSANVSVTSAMVYDATGLALAGTGAPTRVVVERSGPLVQRVLAKDAKAGEGVPAVAGAGRLEVEVSSLHIPIADKKLDVAHASAAVKATLADLSVRTAGADPLTVGAERLSLSLSAAPQTDSPINADGRLLLNGRPMDLHAELKVAGLLEAREGPKLAGLGTRRASGTIALTGVSGSALQGLIAGATTSDAMKRIAAELVGNNVALRIDLGEKTDTASQAVNLAITADGGKGVTATVRSTLKADALEVQRAEGSATLTDALARAVLELAGQRGEAVAAARLREPAGVNLKIQQPVTVPLKPESFSPDWSRANGSVAISGSLSRPAIVDGLNVNGRSLSAGVANFMLDATAPMAVLSGDAPPGGLAGVRLKGSMDVVGNNESDVLAKLRAEGGGADSRITVNLTDVATARLDDVAGQGGLLPGLLGDRATISAVVAQPPGAGGQGAGTNGGRTELSLDVDSPQLTLKKAAFVITKESYRAQEPFTLALTASPALIEQHVLGVKPGEAQKVRVSEPVKMTLNVASLVIAAADESGNGGPLKPGVFALDAKVSVPRLVLTQTEQVAPDAQGGLRGGNRGALSQTRTFISELGDINASITGGAKEGKAGVGFAMNVGTIKSAGQTVTEPTTVNGTIADLADAAGKVTANTAVVNLTAKTGKLPTALVESFVSGNGKLAELLGDEVAANVELRNVSKTGSAGFVNASFKSPKASIVGAGPVSGGVLDTGAPGGTPLKAELTEFRFSGGGTLLAIFPIFAELERASGEANKGPATISTRALRLPIDGDMSKLSGAIDIDLGRVDYSFSKALGNLLDDTIFRGGVGQDQRAVPKFTIDIDRGVLRYGNVQQKVVLPVRNLDFGLRGVVDLVNKRIDVVTYIPTVAAAPGLMANLNKTVGGALGNLVPDVVGKISAVPIRTEGPLDNPSTGYSPQIVLDEFKDVLNPGNLIKGIGDLLGGHKDAPPAKPAAPTPAPSPAPVPGPAPSKPPKKK